MPIPLSICQHSLVSACSPCPVSRLDQVAGEKAALLKTVEAMKKEYVKRSQYPSLLATFPGLIEMMLGGIMQDGTLLS